jgi:hypothetical protein
LSDEECVAREKQGATWLLVSPKLKNSEEGGKKKKKNPAEDQKGSVAESKRERQPNTAKK